MSENGPPTALSTVIIRKLGRLGRFLVFLCTGGWVYPHVCTEGMDLTKIQKEHTLARGTPGE